VGNDSEAAQFKRPGEKRECLTLLVRLFTPICIKEGS